MNSDSDDDIEFTNIANLRDEDDRFLSLSDEDMQSLKVSNTQKSDWKSFLFWDRIFVSTFIVLNLRNIFISLVLISYFGRNLVAILPSSEAMLNMIVGSVLLRAYYRSKIKLRETKRTFAIRGIIKIKKIIEKIKQNN